MIGRNCSLTCFSF